MGLIIFSEASPDANEWAHLILQLQLPMISNGPTIIPGGSSDAHEWAYFASQWELPMVLNGPIIFSEAAPDANEWVHLISQLQLPMISNGPTIIPGGFSDAHEWAYFASQWELPMISNGPKNSLEAASNARAVCRTIGTPKGIFNGRKCTGHNRIQPDNMAKNGQVTMSRDQNSNALNH